MTRRGRITAFGSAGALVCTGIVCAIAVSGIAGALLAFVFISVGLVLVTSLGFLEVGMSEDRARAREYAAALQDAKRRRPRFTRLRSPHDRRLSP